MIPVRDKENPKQTSGFYLVKEEVRASLAPALRSRPAVPIEINRVISGSLPDPSCRSVCRDRSSAAIVISESNAIANRLQKGATVDDYALDQHGGAISSVRSRRHTEPFKRGE